MRTCLAFGKGRSDEDQPELARRRSAVVLAAAAAPAFADVQLAANAGLTPRRGRRPVAERDRHRQVQPQRRQRRPPGLACMPGMGAASTRSPRPPASAPREARGLSLNEIVRRQVQPRRRPRRPPGRACARAGVTATSRSRPARRLVAARRQRRPDRRGGAGMTPDPDRGAKFNRTPTATTGSSATDARLWPGARLCAPRGCRWSYIATQVATFSAVHSSRPV